MSMTRYIGICFNTVRTLLRQNIKTVTSNQLSLMPEGLEQIIDQQQMSDMLAYLLSLREG